MLSGTVAKLAHPVALERSCTASYTYSLAFWVLYSSDKFFMTFVASSRAFSMSAIFSTYSRYPFVVGTRPAEVCGWYMKPSFSRVAMSLRIVAGDT